MLKVALTTMMSQQIPNQSILGLDIGDTRIGVARAGVIAKLPEPLSTLANDQNFVQNLKNIISKEDIGLIVVGLPRNLSGKETAQTQKIRQFVDKISGSFEIEFTYVDESLSSKRADEYLKNTKKKNLQQDSIAACFILEEYFSIMEVKS